MGNSHPKMGKKSIYKNEQVRKYLGKKQLWVKKDLGKKQARLSSNYYYTVAIKRHC